MDNNLRPLRVILRLQAANHSTKSNPSCKVRLQLLRVTLHLQDNSSNLNNPNGRASSPILALEPRKVGNTSLLRRHQDHLRLILAASIQVNRLKVLLKDMVLDNMDHKLQPHLKLRPRILLPLQLKNRSNPKLGTYMKKETFPEDMAAICQGIATNTRETADLPPKTS
jgi:hypothetical protein